MANLKGLFAKLIGNYGDDIARGVANYGDDTARLVANYGDDVAGLATKNSILGSNPNAIINRQPGHEIGHSWITIDSDFDTLLGNYIPGFPTATAVHGNGFEDIVQLQPRTYNSRAGMYVLPQDFKSGTPFKDLVNLSRRYKSPLPDLGDNDLPF